MADLERGERIKELRLARHLTQPAVAEAIGVTLRGYQKYEAGGGIKWDNAKALAKFFRVDPDYLMSGPKTETPDLSRNGQPSQLDRIEAKLDHVIALLVDGDQQPAPPGLVPELEPELRPPSSTRSPAEPKPSRPRRTAGARSRKRA